MQIVKKDQAGQRSKASRSGQGKKSRHPAEDLRREISVMRRALHPNVVALREVGGFGSAVSRVAVGRGLQRRCALGCSSASSILGR
jgi:hypothetical protein